MTRENTPGNDDIVALGASGFGIMAIVAGAERGFITHQQATDRLLRITSFLATADRYRGAWPHFLSGSAGKCLPFFGIHDNGADLVETSFLMEGLLAARHYFKADGPSGHGLYQRITSLWEGMDWKWFRATPEHDALYWHWSPNYAFYIANRLTGWNRVMITYLEAIASPTHGIPASDFYTGFAGENVGTQYANHQTFYGINLDVGGPGTGGPLFFTEYSFMGFDPHGLRNKYTNYFVNNRNQALINQAYCIHNPNHWKGFAANSWGSRRSMVRKGTSLTRPRPHLPQEPFRVSACEISALVFTPELLYQAGLFVISPYRDLGGHLWSIYGFRDSFNLQRKLVLRNYDGPEPGLNGGMMIENSRTGLIWRKLMANPEIAPMLQAIGFRADHTVN